MNPAKKNQAGNIRNSYAKKCVRPAAPAPSHVMATSTNTAMMASHSLLMVPGFFRFSGLSRPFGLSSLSGLTADRRWPISAIDWSLATGHWLSITSPRHRHRSLVFCLPIAITTRASLSLSARASLSLISLIFSRTPYICQRREKEVHQAAIRASGDRLRGQMPASRPPRAPGSSASALAETPAPRMGRTPEQPVS